MRCSVKKIRNPLFRKAIAAVFFSAIASFAWCTKYYWGGDADSNWENTANWYTNETLTTNASSYPQNSITDEIYICTKDDGHNLVFTSAKQVKKFTVNTGKKVDLKDYSITVASASSNFVCNGTIAFDARSTSAGCPLRNTGAVENKLSLFVNCFSSNSIVEINLPSDDSASSVYDYSFVDVAYVNTSSIGFKNLVINLPGKTFTPDGLYVSGSTTINCSKITTSNTVHFAGAVILQSDLELESTNNSTSAVIWFDTANSSIDDASEGQHSLVVNGRCIICGSVGSNKKIKDLTFKRTCIVGNISLVNGILGSVNNDIKVQISGALEFEENVLFRTSKCLFEAEKLIANGDFSRELVSGLPSTSDITFDVPFLLKNDITLSAEKMSFKKAVKNYSAGSAKSFTAQPYGSGSSLNISFEDNVGSETDSIAELNILNAKTVSFSNTVDAASIKSLYSSSLYSDEILTVDIKKSITAHSGNIEFDYGALTIGETTGNEVTIKATGENSKVKFNTKISGLQDKINLNVPAVISAGKDISFGGDSETGGQIEGNNNITVKTTESSSGTIIFKGVIGSTNETTPGNLTIEGNNTCTFKNNVKIHGVINQQNTAIVFAKNFEQLDSSTGDSAVNTFTGNVSFAPGSANATSFKTKQKIIFGAENDDSKTVTFGATGTSTLTIDSNGKDVIFNSRIAAATSKVHSVTINAGTTGDVTFNSSTSNSVYINALTVNAKDITIADGLTFYTGSISVTNSGLYSQKSNIVTDGSFTQKKGSDNALVLIEGTIGTNGTVSFESDVFFKTASGIPAGNNAINFAQNAYIAVPSDATVTLTSNHATGISVGKSFVVCSGTLSLKGNLNVADDLILLGKGSADSYSDKDVDTGVEDLYSYFNSLRPVPGNVAALPEKFPDDSSFPNEKENWCATMSDFGGKVITVGKNFYDNGVDLTSSSTWTLKIPANDNEGSENKFFAEAHNAKIKNSTVAVNTAVTAKGSFAKIAAEGCTNVSGNTDGDKAKKIGWDFTSLEIKEAYTVNDDILCIVFNQPVENSNGELIVALDNIKYNGGQKTFAGIFTDAACTEQLGSGSDVTTIYLKTNSGKENRWNTDATGLSCGAEQSTDRGRTDESPNHSTVVPDIEIARIADSVFATLRDDAKNRIKFMTGEGKRYTATADKCSPVLTAVYTGQELHSDYVASKGASSQPAYDAHNFIEFQYSEPVTIGNLVQDAVNVRSETSFDAATKHGGAITNNSQGITVTGFATIASGKVESGERTDEGSISSGSESTTIHSLYRKFRLDASAAEDTVQNNRVRIAIAGYADGTVNVDSKEYNNWKGYITEAETPSGTVTRIANSFIKDAAGNILDAGSEEDTAHSLPAISVNDMKVTAGLNIEEDKTLYGIWDVSAPQFVLWSKNGDWTKGKSNYNNTNGDVEFEIIVSTGSATGTQLDRIEFHVFDNTPSYDNNDPYLWISKYGWYSNGTIASDKVPDKPAYDISGGSRYSNSNNANRTAGGLRRSSLTNSYNAFKYKNNSVENSSVKNFNSKAPAQVAINTLFYYSEGAGKTEAPADDSLYFALYLDENDKTLPLTTTFDISFTQENCFMTDLAGNVLRGPSSGKLSSLNRSAPQFALSLAAVGKKEMIVLFSKKLDSSLLTAEKLNNLKEAFEFVKMDGTASSIKFAAAKPEIVYPKASVTCIKFFLQDEVSLNDIKTTYVRVAKPTKASEDEQTGMNSYASIVKDEYENSMISNSVHALSDFAINAVLPVNASSSTDAGLAGADNITFNKITKFDRTHGMDNTLPVNSEITFDVSIANKRNADNSVNETTTDKAVMYFDASITGPCSDQFNNQTGASANVWLPIALPAFTSKPNVPENEGLAPSSSGNNGNLIFKLDKEKFNWKSGSNVQFLFAITDNNGNLVTIDNDGENSSAKIPLYSLRLIDQNDLTSFDLWQFSLLAAQKQRGGVTILDNVINVVNQEKVTVQIDTEKTNLKIVVMTLDGNVIKYLENRNVEAGTYYYRWDGKNNAGNYVARGLYFIRVLSDTMDETRKVIVVK